MEDGSNDCIYMLVERYVLESYHIYMTETYLVKDFLRTGIDPIEEGRQEHLVAEYCIIFIGRYVDAIVVVPANIIMSITVPSIQHKNRKILTVTASRRVREGGKGQWQGVLACEGRCLWKLQEQ